MNRDVVVGRETQSRTADAGPARSRAAIHAALRAVDERRLRRLAGENAEERRRDARTDVEAEVVVQNPVVELTAVDAVSREERDTGQVVADLHRVALDRRREFVAVDQPRLDDRGDDAAACGGVLPV